MFSVNYIFLMNITYIFAIITCLVFLMKVFAKMLNVISNVIHVQPDNEYNFLFNCINKSTIVNAVMLISSIKG